MTPAERPPDDPEPAAEPAGKGKPGDGEHSAGDDAPLRELSDLHRMSAPQNFEDVLTETIRRRSGGRFFGPKRLSDRIPFFWLAIVAIVVGLIIFLLIRSSDTGSLRYQPAPDRPEVHPEASEQMPSPYQ